MFYAKILDPEGLYVDSDGKRFCISAARRVRSPQGVNAGFVEFPSLEVALEHWGLVACLPESQEHQPS